MAILIITFVYFSLMTFIDQLSLHLVKKVSVRNVKQWDLIGNKSNTFPVLFIFNWLTNGGIKLISFIIVHWTQEITCVSSQNHVFRFFLSNTFAGHFFLHVESFSMARLKNSAPLHKGQLWLYLFDLLVGLANT